MKYLILISFLFLSCSKEAINDSVQEPVIINKLIGEYKHESGTIADNPKGNIIITKDSLKLYTQTYKIDIVSDTELKIYDVYPDSHKYEKFYKDGNVYKLHVIAETFTGNTIFLKIK